MLLLDTFQTAYRAVGINKSRSLLTMLGIIIGVGSVTLMTGIGKSMEGVILGQISVLGPESMIIFPGAGPEGGGIKSVGFDSLTKKELNMLKDLKTGYSWAPVITVPTTVSYRDQESEPQVLAAHPNYYQNINLDIARGRLLDESDEKSARFVAIIGSDTAIDLFPNEDPIGKRVKVSGRTFTIVGILESVGTAFFQNQDERLIMPLSTGQQITAQKYFNFISFKHTGDSEFALIDTESVLRQSHSITDPDDDIFIVRSSSQAKDIFGSVSLGLTLFITSIAAISLIVGGIGIMNIMLVAVTERTREIGLRKAIGATEKDILYQFLVESVLLTLIGGIIGIFFGVLLAFLLAFIINIFLADYTFAISAGAIVIATIMAAVTGLAFGVYPAKKAAELSPMEALRYE